MPVAATTIDRLKSAVGPQGFSEDQAEIAPHLVEWRGRYQGSTSLLLKPRSAEEISAVLSICNQTRTPIVTQGGNTGLVGGQIPHHGEVLLSLGRMNRIRSIDVEGMNAVCEAGVVLSDLQLTADRADVFFPLSLAAEGSATIGGNLSTNAGGVNVLRYGAARQLVLGLEVVLADGRLLDLLRRLHKDNSGYDLKQLFVGAEGTLGIVTAAALRLFPKPRRRETAFIAVRDPAAAVALLRRLQEASGGLVSAFELMPRLGLDLVLAHIAGARDPLPTVSPWYVLAEATSGSAVPLARILEETIDAAANAGLATDAALARSDAQRSALWGLRESLSEAQKREGPAFKHDVSVPLHAAPELLSRGSALAAKLIPGVRPVPFGHLGDGNIHFDFLAPKGADEGAFLDRRDEVTRAVHDLVHAAGGSVSAEHGIGVMKRDEIARYKSAAELEVMRGIKRTFDPNNILNPGVILDIAR